MLKSHHILKFDGTPCIYNDTHKGRDCNDDVQLFKYDYPQLKLSLEVEVNHEYKETCSYVQLSQKSHPLWVTLCSENLSYLPVPHVMFTRTSSSRVPSMGMTQRV